MIPLKDNLRPRRFPVVTYLLILINLTVFLYELSLGRELMGFIFKYSVIPAHFFSGGERNIFGQLYEKNLLELYGPLISSMFLHGGWMHIITNMLYLGIFGDNVEDKLGRTRFLLFYLASGVAAASTHMIMNSNSDVPSLGASGAVAGVLGAYILLYPKAKVLTVLPIFFILQFFEVPAFFFIGIWIMQQFLSGAISLSDVAAADAGGIAWWAHIGGFIAGLLLVLILRQTLQLRTSLLSRGFSNRRSSEPIQPLPTSATILSIINHTNRA